MDWMRKMISNLYKIKWGEEESKYKKEKKNEGSVTAGVN